MSDLFSKWTEVSEDTNISDTLKIDKSAPDIKITDSPWERGGEGEETKPIKSGW